MFRIRNISYFEEVDIYVIGKVYLVYIALIVGVGLYTINLDVRIGWAICPLFFFLVINKSYYEK